MRILFFIITILFSSIGFSQVLLDQNLGSTSSSYQNYVQNIETWKSGKDLSNEKGYKWINRWSEFYAT